MAMKNIRITILIEIRNQDLESHISKFSEKNRIKQEPGWHQNDSNKKKSRADKIFGHMTEDLYDDIIE
ncbi:hypothetical protein AYI69_g1163 [Smittium culicis]|uniref:Uncharacterized protein n=1 Tax=Smittium culicis TaxID=133412 RepID=A0A1R1YR07_9FUNG|nr:hypothetical protein AYI69_g1163 [Smittium culicis]